MATYEIETDGGKYQVDTEEPQVLPTQTNMVTPSGFPEPQASDNPAPGEEKPIEQKLAENALQAGSGAGLASGIGALGEAGAGLLGLTKNVASNAGAMGTAGQYAKRFAQNQAMKSIGARSGQIGQVGIPESRAIAQKLIDQNVVSPFRGPIGLEEKINELHSATGQTIGGARKAADTFGQAPSMAEILQQVKQDLEPKYSSGMDKGISGLNRAREEIAKGGTGTFVGNAQKATDLNSLASEGKVYRPTGAATDTADIISRLNNEGMGKVLSPKGMEKYNTAKENYGALQKVLEFLKSGERRELSGRGGAATVGKALADQTMDMMGNRVAATGLNAAGNILQSQPLQQSVNPLETYLLNKDEEDR